MTVTALDEDLTAEEVLDWAPRILGTTASRLTSLATTVPDELLRRRPLAGEWSAYEVLHHLVDTERLVFPVRIRAILAGATTIEDIDLNDVEWDEGQSAGQIVRVFAGLRADTLGLLAELTPADLGRTVTHSAYGEVSLGQMLHYFPAHDLTHLIQIERAVMQPFLPGTGPWADNVADMRMR